MENNQISLNIYDYIVSKNHDAKDRIAIDYLGRKYTFKELLDNMNIVMQSLSEYGIKKGDSIMALTLATPKLLFCYDRFYTKILGKIDNKKIVITSPFDSLPLAMKLTGKIQKLSTNKECITYSEFISKGKKRAKKIEEDTADISNKKIIEIGTGGSTGIPKQVGISNEMLNNVVYQHEIMNKYSVFDVSFNDNETFLDIIPPHLAYGICDIHLALSLKLKLCLEPNPEPKLFVKQLKKYRPNHVLAGPVHWKQLIAYDKKIDLSYIKSAVAGGEHLECNDEIKTNQKLKESGSKVTVREGVGLTEICGVGTYNGDLFTVGKPLPEYQVGIFKVDINKEYNDNTHTADELCRVYYQKDKNGELKIVSTGMNNSFTTGEICYQLPIKILGYVGEEHKEENDLLIRLHDDGKYWIHTGDIGYIREDRNLVITDRIKRIFNRYGRKVYPNHITKIVTDSDLIKECVVVKRESLVKGESYVPILYAVVKENTTENRQKLLEWCNKKIIGNSSLYDIIFVDELPKTGAGKIDFTRVENYDKNHNEPVVQDNNEKNKCKKIKIGKK